MDQTADGTADGTGDGIGVVLVTYATGDVVLDCLDALRAAARHPGAPPLKVVVVDNLSPDGTRARLEAWAERTGVRLAASDLREGPAPVPGPLAEDHVALVQSGENRGFAAGVNHGLRVLEADPATRWFWVLNSDALTAPHTPAVLARAARAAEAEAPFGALGGRLFLTEPPLTIQTDGGAIDWATGRLFPANAGRTGHDVPGPARPEYICGGHMLVSRDFLAAAGPMPEEWFLYFEEVDWILRAPHLPLAFVPGAEVHHVGGASIGSDKGGGKRGGGKKGGGGPSALAAYWMFRNRLRFVDRHGRPRRRGAMATAWAFGAAKVAQLAKRRHWAAARAAARGMRDYARHDRPLEAARRREGEPSSN